MSHRFDLVMFDLDGTLGIQPCKAIYVGDQLTDADAARAAGVAFGAVCWGHGAPQALAQAAPEATFETVDALRRLARSTQPDARFIKAQPVTPKVEQCAT